MNARQTIANSLPVKLQQRADGAAGLPAITGYAAVFYRADDPGTQYKLWGKVFERIGPTAFNRAIAAGGDDVRALFNHSDNHVLGRLSAGTLRLSVDSRGLRYEIDPPDTQAARDLVESIRRGDVSGSSFSFIPRETIDTEVPDGGYILTRTDVQLIDVGPVTFPAYTGTAAGVRSSGDLERLRAEVESRRGAARDRDAVALTLAWMDTEEGD